jgi:hypothetical protein
MREDLGEGDEGLSEICSEFLTQPGAQPAG